VALGLSLTPPDASGLLSWATTVACLLLAGAILYAIRRRFIPR